MNFAGKTVLLTGAVGGLGKTAVTAFARAGAKVLAVDIKDAEGRELERRVEPGAGGRIIYVPLDLADAGAVRRGLDAIVQEHGVIDVLVNNAAVYPSKPFEEFDVEEYRHVQAVNVDAHVQCALSLVPGMKKRGWGRIINVSSITFYGGWDKLFPYVASKGALVALTRAWAREFGPHGITVNAISPGAFPTDAEKIHADPEGYSQQVLDRQAIKRRGAPEDIAHAMMFLASDEAGFISGQTLNVDGGWVMH